MNRNKCLIGLASFFIAITMLLSGGVYANDTVIPPIEEWNLVRERDWNQTYEFSPTEGRKEIKVLVGKCRLYEDPASNRMGSTLSLFATNRVIMKGWWQKDSFEGSLQVVLITEKDIVVAVSGVDVRVRAEFDNNYNVVGLRATTKKEDGQTFEYVFKKE